MPRVLSSLGSDCPSVPVVEIAQALIALSYLEASDQSFDAIEHGYRAWLADKSGLGMDSVGAFDEPIELVGPSLVRICPESAWAILAGQAAAESVEPDAPPSAPVTISPFPPSAPGPAPRREASFAPENSVFSWLFLGAVLGATYWYVRKYRRSA